MFFARVHVHRQHAATGGVATNAQCRFNAFGQALLQVGAHLDAIDHHINVVLAVLVQHRQAARIHHGTVDAKADVALGLHLGE